MKLLAIIAARFVSFVGKFVGRGSALPGAVALKIDKNILSKIEIPKLSIAITGTTGKTSTTQTIADVFKSAGYKVAHNLSGANLIDGITTLLLSNVTLSGKTKADVLVLEIDERYAKVAFQYFKPNYFVVTNLSRDQLARNGHYDIVFDDIKRVISDDMHLVLNGDDPLVCQLALDHHGETTYFGIGKHDGVQKVSKTTNLDFQYCPICHQKLIFDYYQYGNLGNYHCPNHDYDRPKCDYEVTSIDMKNGYFTINKQAKIKLQHDIVYNIYNNLVVYTISKLCNISEEKICSVLENFNFTVKRFDEFVLNGRNGYILTSKNETPISYNQSLEYVAQDNAQKTIVFGFTHVSGRYELKDLSWLWDVEFEHLDNASIDQVICVGPYADELAQRIYHAGIEENKIVRQYDPDKCLATIKETGKGTIYALVYFDLAKLLTKQLKSEGIL